jgi:hypothetical protein
VNESSLLETTAEVAVAFAGFIGIFLVLTTRDGRFAPGDSLSIRAIVLASVVPVFYCAVPLVLHSLGVSGAMLWRISSGIIGLAGSAIIAYMVPQLLALSPAERSSFNNLVGSSLAALAFLCSVANTLGWPWAPSGGLFLLAVWLCVAIAGTYFVALIFRRVL